MVILQEAKVRFHSTNVMLVDDSHFLEQGSQFQYKVIRWRWGEIGLG